MSVLCSLKQAWDETVFSIPFYTLPHINTRSHIPKCELLPDHDNNTNVDIFRNMTSSVCEYSFKC